MWGADGREERRVVLAVSTSRRRGKSSVGRGRGSGMEVEEVEEVEMGWVLGMDGEDEEGVVEEEVEAAREREDVVEGVVDVDEEVEDDGDEEGDDDGEVVGNGLESARNAAVVLGDIFPCLNSFNRSTNSKCRHRQQPSSGRVRNR